jgi:60 kDa SS-A/Ro ribonucleoprotein
MGSIPIRRRTRSDSDFLQAKCCGDTSVCQTGIAGSIPAVCSMKARAAASMARRRLLLAPDGLCAGAGSHDAPGAGPEGLLMFKYSKITSKTATQAERLPGTDQVANSAGGYVWKVDHWVRLDRFLILGSEGGTYYITERTLTLDNAKAVVDCIAEDGVRTVRRIAEISHAGRAPKNDPAIFALAMCAKLGDEVTRAAAYAALGKVCRIGTHLMQFAEYAQSMAGWFNDKPAKDLAYQLVKYQQRNGWSTRDLLRLAHPRASSPSHDALFAWVTKGALPESAGADEALAILTAMEEAKRTSQVKDIVRLIRAHNLPREALPTPWLTLPEVWEALLAEMPMTAMLRNLATMTRIGLLSQTSAATQLVVERLQEGSRLRKARVHPIAILAALLTYRSGHSARGQSSWRATGKIVDALDAAFYKSFGDVEPSGKRTLLALDVSGSMSSGTIAGVPGLSPRVGSAAMALVTAATEKHHAFVAFTAASGGYGGQWGGGQSGITPLAISARQRLDDVVREVSRLPMGGTDCALPMIWAQKERADFDTFVIYTDNETWAGSVHPAQALRAYRQARGIPAKLAVVGMTSTGFTIADPEDAGMMDVVGFDPATPPVISDFARA